jgi:hypothetical protein
MTELHDFNTSLHHDGMNAINKPHESTLRRRLRRIMSFDKILGSQGEFNSLQMNDLTEKILQDELLRIDV